IVVRAVVVDAESSEAGRAGVGVAAGKVPGMAGNEEEIWIVAADVGIAVKVSKEAVEVVVLVIAAALLAMEGGCRGSCNQTAGDSHYLNSSSSVV
ncbi:MAG: hypothetical protein O7C59_07160, partial [Rickettsia endosymbiont of Ixodes persulcatus]|nr:hypothetical protein [Rickettsia endosymbiont of Ixodes persulcatus]